MALDKQWIAALGFGAVFLWTVPVHAQRGGADWTTAGGDAQRSSWLRSDPKISIANLQKIKPGFDLVWKIKVGSEEKQAFLPPVLLDRYIGYRGFRSLGLIGLPGNRIVGIDIDLGRIEWREQLPASASGCASASAAVTRSTPIAFPGPPAAMSMFRRGGPAKSAVGQAFEGAVTIQQATANMGGGRGPGGRGPAGRGPAGRGAYPAFRRMPSLLYVVTTDGKLHSVFVSNGEAYQPAVQFLPANSNVEGLIVVDDDVAYAAAGPGCGAAPDTIAAFDISAKKLATYKPASGGIAGAFGPAIAPDGTLYVATTAGDLVALEAKTLKVKDTFHAGQAFTSSPVLIEYKEKAVIAAATKDGRIHLLDAAALSKPLFESEAGGPVVSRLAAWQDPTGTHWLMGPSSGAVVAWKVADRNGTPGLQTGWTSRDLAAPLAPIVVDNVAFTASTGSSPVVYALDPSTGKELWNSGRKIAASVRGGGLSVGNSQVYLGADDGMLYVFGFPIEH